MNTAYKEEIYSMVSNTNDTEILKKIHTFVKSWTGSNEIQDINHIASSSVDQKRSEIERMLQKICIKEHLNHVYGAVRYFHSIEENSREEAPAAINPK